MFRISLIVVFVFSIFSYGNPPVSFEESKRIVREAGVTSQEDFERRWKKEFQHQDVISPSLLPFQAAFKGWNDFLGMTEPELSPELKAEHEAYLRKKRIEEINQELTDTQVEFEGERLEELIEEQEELEREQEEFEKKELEPEKKELGAEQETSQEKTSSLRDKRMLPGEDLRKKRIEEINQELTDAQVEFEGERLEEIEQELIEEQEELEREQEEFEREQEEFEKKELEPEKKELGAEQETSQEKTSSLMNKRMLPGEEMKRIAEVERIEELEGEKFEEDLIAWRKRLAEVERELKVVQEAFEGKELEEMERKLTEEQEMLRGILLLAEKRIRQHADQTEKPASDTGGRKPLTQEENAELPERSAVSSEEGTFELPREEVGRVESKEETFDISRVGELGILSEGEFLKLSYFGENSKVENTALGKAVARGDREAYRQAIAELAKYEVVGVKFFSIFHKTTADGNTLFDLMIFSPQDREFFTTELIGVLSAMATMGRVQAEELVSLRQTAAGSKNKLAENSLSRLYNLLLKFEKKDQEKKLADLKDERKRTKSNYWRSLDHIFIKSPLMVVASMVLMSLPVESFDVFVQFVSEATGFKTNLPREARLLQVGLATGSFIGGMGNFAFNANKCFRTFSSRRKLKKDIFREESRLKAMP